MSTSLVLGSTGLVGNTLIKFLCDQNENVIALTRRSIPNLPRNANELIVDFDDFLIDGSLPKCDHVFICLGTTIKVAGSQENFRKVDIDYCLSVAQRAKKSGANTLSLISSIGAKSSSKNFYLKTKGQLEEAIQELGFPTINIFRPSFLVGQRAEKRSLERIAIILASFMNFFLLGSARRYRSIKVELLAKTMISSKNTKPGVNYFFFDDFLK